MVLTIIYRDLIDFLKNDILKGLLSFCPLFINFAKTKVCEHAQNVKEYLYNLWTWVPQKNDIWNYLTTKRSEGLSSCHRYVKQLWRHYTEVDLEVADDDQPSECA